jgi:hypothetical protein
MARFSAVDPGYDMAEIKSHSAGADPKGIVLTSRPYISYGRIMSRRRPGMKHLEIGRPHPPSSPKPRIWRGAPDTSCQYIRRNRSVADCAAPAAGQVQSGLARATAVSPTRPAGVTGQCCGANTRMARIISGRRTETARRKPRARQAMDQNRWRFNRKSSRLPAHLTPRANVR